MSNVVIRVTSLLKDTQSMEDAVKVLTSAYKKLSSTEAKNTVQDIIDYRNEKMVESELKYRLEERGLTA